MVEIPTSTMVSLRGRDGSHDFPTGFDQLQDAFLGLSDGSLSLSIHTPGQATVLLDTPVV